jgi:hypothetical protein
MPFGISKSKNKWKVINKHTGRVLGTHDSEGDAKKQLAAVQINYGKESEEKEMDMNLNESNELIMSLSHKYKISVNVLEQLWTEAISKQEENAKSKEEKDKGSPQFWKGVRSNFKKLIDNLDIQEAKAIMDSRERYTDSTSQWLDHLQSGDYSAAEKVFPEIIKAKLDVMINNGKEKYLKQMSDKINKQSKEG